MLRAVILIFFAALSGLAQSEQSGGCPLSPAKVQTALGVEVLGAKPGLSMKAGGVDLQDCRYSLKDKSQTFTLMVKTSAYTRSLTAAQHFESFAGRLVPVPNDPDGARFQENQGDLSSPTVHYFRKGTGVELRLLGNYYAGLKPTDTEFRAWQKKLLALPRIP